MFARKVVIGIGVFGLVSAFSLVGYFTYRYIMLDRSVSAGEFALVAKNLDAIPGSLEPFYTVLALEAVEQALEADSTDGLDPLLSQVLASSIWREALRSKCNDELLVRHRYDALARLVSTPAFTGYGTPEFFHSLHPLIANELITFLELVAMERRYESATDWNKAAEAYRECDSDWCVWHLGELLAEPDSPLMDLMALEKHVREHQGDILTKYVGQEDTAAQQYLMAFLSRRISPQRRFDLLRQAAEGGSAAAWWRLAEMAEPGSEDADILLRAAADAGHPLAMTLMAVRFLAAGEQETGFATLERAALAGFDDLWRTVGTALLKGDPLRFPHGSWARRIRLDDDVVIRNMTLPEYPVFGMSWLQQGAERGDRSAAAQLYMLQANGEYGLDPDDHHTLAWYAWIEDRGQRRSVNAVNQAWSAIRKVRSSPQELMALAEQWQDLIEASAEVEARWVEALRERKYEEVLLAIAARHDQPSQFLYQLFKELKLEAAGHPAVESLLGRLTTEQVQHHPELFIYVAGFAPLSSVTRLVELGAPVNVSLSPDDTKPGTIILHGLEMPRVPLLAAVYHGREQIAQYLLDQGADINSEYRGVNSVSVALVRGYPRLAKYLWDDVRFTHRTPSLETKVERAWAEWADWYEWSDSLSFTFLSASGKELGADAPPQHRQCVRDKATGLTWVIPSPEAESFAARRAIYGYSPEGTDCNETHCPMLEFQAEVEAARPCGISAWRFPSARELGTLTFPGYRGVFPANLHSYLWVRIGDSQLGLARVDDLFGQKPLQSAVVEAWKYQPPASAMLVTGELSKWPPPLKALPEYELFPLAVSVPDFDATSVGVSE